MSRLRKSARGHLKQAHLEAMQRTQQWWIDNGLVVVK